MLYAFARWLGPLIVTFTLDNKGRKQPIITGFLVSAALAFAVGGIFSNQQNMLSMYYMDVIKYLLIFYQLFASVSMASSSVYLSEAIDTEAKSW